MNQRTKVTFKEAGKRIGFLCPQSSTIHLDYFIKRINASTVRVPTEKRGVNGFYGWQEIDVSECRSELRRLVGQWIANKKHLGHVLDLNEDLNECSRDCKAMLLPDRDGKAQVSFVPKRLPNVTPSRNEALLLFTNLLVNPFSEKLSGPCAYCDCYFVNDTLHRRKYCSRKCSSAKTAASRNAVKRKKEREDKLRRARVEIERCKKLRAKDWKACVCTGDPEISKKWLTRAVNDGLLAPP